MKLVNYRDTPHLSTGVHMLFKDEFWINLAHNPTSKEVILSAGSTDNCIKTERKFDYNTLHYVRPCNFEIGDERLVMDYEKSIFGQQFDLFTLPKNSKLLMY